MIWSENVFVRSFEQKCIEQYLLRSPSHNDDACSSRFSLLFQRLIDNRKCVCVCVREIEREREPEVGGKIVDMYVYVKIELIEEM